MTDRRYTALVLAASRGNLDPLAQAGGVSHKTFIDIAGVPMVVRVAQRAAQSGAQQVVVAADDAAIVAACQAHGVRALLTRTDHASGSDRLAEACELLGLDGDTLVVNVQGDEPLIEGFVIDAVVAALEAAPEAPMATLVHAADPDALDDPNRVKVVLDRRGDALYFSRSRIPAVRDPAAPARFHQHVGLYAYRRPFLLEFIRLAPTPLERCEALEQLRALEHGHRIRCAVIEGWRSLPVDVPGDVPRVEAALREAGRC